MARFSKKKFIAHKICVFIFSTNLSETFLIVRPTEREMIINVRRSSCTVHVILARFNETCFSRQSFGKYSYIKFHENPSSGSRVVPCGQKDIHDEANSRFSQFAQAHKFVEHLSYLRQQIFPCKLRYAS